MTYKCQTGDIARAPTGTARRMNAVDEAMWLVSFMDDDLEYTELEQTTLQLPENRLAGGCHPCDRNNPSPMSSECTNEGLAEGEGRSSNPKPRAQGRRGGCAQAKMAEGMGLTSNLLHQ